jgi:two-component system, cell cycle sensor histidine kinase and response regulator CckA
MSTEAALDTRAGGGTLLGGEHRVLELIATGASLADTLDALCRVIDEQSGFMSAVFLLNHEGARLLQAAGPHLPAIWREATRSVPATPTSTACGLAIHQREQVIVPDVLASALFADLWDAARAAGLTSVWSTPFFSKESDPLGTFAMVDNKPIHPSEAQIGLVARATYLASIAVERHVTEKGLRESERRFSTAFYANPACMAIQDSAGDRFLYVNDAFLRMFGYSRAEVIGCTAAELDLYADLSERPRLRQMLADGKLHDVDVKARTKTGEILDLVLSMERIQLLGEERVLQIAMDLTDRQRTEKALRRSEELLRLVLETIPVGVIVLDPAGDIILSNRASRQIWADVIHSGPERYRTSQGWWRDGAGPRERRDVAQRSHRHRGVRRHAEDHPELRGADPRRAERDCWRRGHQ